MDSTDGSMIDVPRGTGLELYEVFADWAKRKGLEAAASRFESTIGAAQVEAFKRQFEEDVARVENGGPPIIAAGKSPWYSGPGEADVFWPELEKSFRADGWDDDRLLSVDRASSIVVAHTPRPDRSRWSSKGLVVGYVQSGKTTNFTAVIAKLADVNYDLIIVLSGIHNGLRRQTQVRLNEALKEAHPSRWLTLTAEDNDFKRPTFTLSSAIKPDSGSALLAVVKKNGAVLRRLVRWLDTPDSRKALRVARVLVIDDEADQASVATKRINPLIRKLISLPDRCTYIGYTATPFANVFIDPAQDDLYPKSFILNLPLPGGYFGPEMIFGRDVVEGDDDGPAPDGYDMIRSIPESDMPQYRPMGKQAASDFAPAMTQELKDAVAWFWLASAARRARGDDKHSTMLIHTSVKIDVHESYKQPLDDMRTEALREIDQAEDGLGSTWQELWQRESARVPATAWGRRQNSFSEVWSHLRDVVSRSRVILDNYRSQDRLDYEGDEPVVAIAVGGNTLSRGLTLEGLVVSLFVRGATTYDTLLQMGRWFGYRNGYEDLPRIWMTPSLKAQFRHLAAVEHDMRADIDRYQHEDLTPTDVAVRVRTHPSLRITAKMGAAGAAYVSYAGRRLQTRYFFTQDQEWLDDNLRAAAELLQAAAVTGRPDDRDGVHLIRDVPVALVRTFLEQYGVHPDSADLDRSMLLNYIDKQVISDEPSLLLWSVAVVSGGGEEVALGDLRLKGVIRSRLNDQDATRADIKTLMSKQDRALDLDLTAEAARAAGEQELVELRNDDPVHRERALLVLYPIERHSEPVKKQKEVGPDRVPLAAARTVLGLGLVFPGNAQVKNRVAATYMAVDLTDVETVDLDDALEEDTENEA